VENDDMETPHVNKTQIGKMHRALVEFGYESLKFLDVEVATKRVLSGEDVGGDIIAMFVRDFLDEAGILKKS
jgi:hypothetical protein